MDNQIALLGNELVQGEKARLTTLSKADLADIEAWYDNSGSSFLTVNQKLVTAEAWLNDQQENSNYLFGIRTNEDQTLIGACRLSNILWQSRCTEMTVSIEHPKFVGQGFETDVVRTMLRYAFMDANLNRVAARLYATDDSIITAFEEAGMQIEGQLRQADYQDNGYVNIVVLGILQREWMELANR